jgi:hypothetical protein
MITVEQYWTESNVRQRYKVLEYLSFNIRLRKSEWSELPKHIKANLQWWWVKDKGLKEYQLTCPHHHVKAGRNKEGQRVDICLNCGYEQKK